ncbi:hypothetical protein GDO81_021272 [Engystomops pustulosus]|uniref:Uncharacterized protein n=1 Tax=Engystomops pustulosus TaxID=76066 RepID=A0AAV6Z7R6_ENGPU|nr:hypothetical protein GDO81_021272 [Engystomops pustulosus]
MRRPLSKEGPTAALNSILFSGSMPTAVVLTDPGIHSIKKQSMLKLGQFNKSMTITLNIQPKSCFVIHTMKMTFTEGQPL